MEVKQLDERLIQMANSNSFNGTRGDLSAQSYKSYADEILGWNISDVKKQKLLDKLYTKYSELLKLEAQHVSVMVAGPANYNSKRLDKSDQVLQKTHEFFEWFDDLRNQIKNSNRDTSQRKLKLALEDVETFIDLGLDPTKSIMCIATMDNKKFIELFEKYQDKYKWRKNSNIYKMYETSLNGELKEIKPEVFYEDENFTAYVEGDRAFIKFLMRPQRQLIVALKNRKWWWNAHKQAWSTYLNRLDKEWVSTISERYAKYL